MRLAGIAVSVALGLLFARNAFAQALPVEIRQDGTRYNLASTNGMPLSSIRNNPPGSDGRAPTNGLATPSNPSGAPGTINQFRSLLSWGGVSRPGVNSPNQLLPGLNYARNAEVLDLPRSRTNGQISIVMTRAAVGQPFLSRSISFLFGSPVPVPDTDEFGINLAIANSATGRAVARPEDYWAEEPYTTTGHTNASYYWSPHAQSVFASSAGQVPIVWRRAVSAMLGGNRPAGVGVVQIDGSPFVVWTNRYVVSSSPVKPPRTIYWTERSFVDTGKPVAVPSARVSEVKIAYNNTVVERVEEEIEIPGVVPITETNTLDETRTLWFDNSGGAAGGQIRAYNREGRVLVELLGDDRGNGLKQHLGYEIVEVVRQPSPTDVTTELGEPLTPYQDIGAGDAGLFPEPLFQSGPSFTFQFSPAGGTRTVYYATRETINQNDLQVHWLEPGLEGLRWPFRFVRYKLAWPEDVARYSHYIRPATTSAAEAAETAVALPTDNAPILNYQDPLDQPRGFLSETFAYYSWLTPEYPAHRALLRFSAGGNIRFERVFSWLDQSLRNSTTPISTAFNSSFTSAAGGTGYGSSYVGGGVLHLADAIYSTNGNYVLNDFTGGRAVESFRANFNVRIWDGTSASPDGGADGFGFSFGEIPDGLYPAYPAWFADEGTANGLAVNFDLWDNTELGPDWAPGIVIKTNGVNLAGVAMRNGPTTPNFVPDPQLLPVPIDPATGQPMSLLTDGAFVPVSIVLYRDGRMDVSFKGVKVLENVQTGYRPRTGRFGFSARTGGLWSAQWVDDLSIVVNENLVAADPSFATSVATNLSVWSAANAVGWTNEFIRPRSVDLTVNVGDRILAPDGEIGGGNDTNYLAGFIRRAEGDSFHPGAYVDPFALGFETANRGAIIPVNAIPGENQLEVWWFRKNQVNRGQGFKNSHWPAIIGRYTLQWPADASEIVLASNDGSGGLPSLQAKGQIYRQNDRTAPGYNPNEEHALMQGGQAFALRDDLNITSGPDYSSHPYVLLDYLESDGRPAMRLFKVLRERPDLGITFDYVKEAGAILQPPMPLPLLEKALAPNLVGQAPKNLNTEITEYQVASSTRAVAGSFVNYSLTTVERHYVRRYQPHALQNRSALAEPYWFFPTNVGVATAGGWISTSRPLSLNPWTGVPASQGNRWRFAAVTAGWSNATSVLLFNTGSNLGYAVNITAVSNEFVEVEFAVTTPVSARSADFLLLPTGTPVDNAFAGHRLAPEALPTTPMPAATRDFYASFTLQDRKGNTWVYRGPHDDQEAPVLVMKYYYKTLPGFFFPTLALDAQPSVGTITPYLRGTNANGTFEGDPVFGNILQPRDGDGQPLGITYRPVWPENPPVLQMAETLTLPKRGLPAARGQTSLEVVYQQSQVSGGDEGESVVLHDPTREKSFELGAPDGPILDAIPASVKSQSFQGKTYFPNLPPHLAERVFLDPNRGPFGALVFKGEFVDAALGDKYVFLNVLGESDAASVKALCTSEDEDKARWDTAVDGLTTTMELFVENPAQPGSYIPSAPVQVSRTELARVSNDDEAVDSYALTATGPGTGFVTLIAGNGRAFTPEGDPVSVQIIKVVDTLYRGEVNIVESSNPLNERLTLQQVVDLAGKSEEFNFQWLIASPVDGLPPVVYQNTPATLLSDGSWSHVRFPSAGDAIGSIQNTAQTRVVQDVTTSVAPLTTLAFTSVAPGVDNTVAVETSVPHRLSPGTRLAVRKADNSEIVVRVQSAPAPTSTGFHLRAEDPQAAPLADGAIIQIFEVPDGGMPQSIVFREFTEFTTNVYSGYWLSLNLDHALGAKVYLDGQLVVTANLGAEDTATANPATGLFPLGRVYRLDPSALAGGVAISDVAKRHLIAVEFFSNALPGAFVSFNARLEAYQSVDVTAQQWLPLDAERYPDGVRAVIGGSADVRSLADNYLIMRYQPRNSDHASYVSDGQGGNRVWSQWTTPQLAEGWIKRVLKGINPFNQRITDLFNNSVNTDVSIVAQAGQRWEGDVALNLDTINSAGLIEIYETVLNRGKLISIGGGINYGPANDALLLAAGYLNDLYMVLGNEAWADAANPTIGIGTKDNTYGDIATSLFSFRGQLPSLLEEELALMRGRDDFLLPGVELRPVYNRMIWNYTRGIDAGEVVYALNYNVLDQNNDGKVDADDARRLYPQGHGDAYGHFLTALKGYYSLLLNNNFDWVPRIEAVTVLGKPVSVDYQDERKFAAAAGALARAGRQTFDLTWRRDYKSGAGNGWSHLETTKGNTTTRNLPTTRYWGMDHWASRTGQGSYLNWVVGNAILPDRDPDPSHEGSIQQIDRTTVPELKELTALSSSLQTSMDNAEAGLTPLGLPDNAIPFDLNPLAMATGPNSHFEQIYSRALTALNNAVTSFDDAKDVTRLMRSEEDSLAEFRTMVNQQELAYTNALIEIYGTPYPDDIGPGKTYRTGFAGPDLIHYAYIDNVEINFNGLLDPASDVEWKIDTQTFSAGWADDDLISTFGFITLARTNEVDGTGQSDDYLANTNLFISYNLSSHGFFQKPATWTGRRASPGRVQQAISDIVKARNAAFTAFYWADAAKYDLDWAIVSFNHKKASHETIRDWQTAIEITDQVSETAQAAYDIADKYIEQTVETLEDIDATILEAIPKSFLAGLAAGGDLTAPARGAILGASGTVKNVTEWSRVIAFSVVRALTLANDTANRFIEFYDIQPEEWNQELRDATSEIRDKVYGMNNWFMTINARLQELDDALRAYRSLLAEGDRIQLERQIFRQRSAAVIQGFRTRDAAFRIFRNEKLERYKSLFDLSARYAYMAAQAYDYDTGLLGTPQGREFVNQIVRSRALGVVQNGAPQFAGASTGDPGLSSSLAGMAGDWSVVRSRLGFNNPDAYGTTVSLRSENFRILPGTNGHDSWKDILNQSRKADLLEDPDVRRYCMQIDSGNGLPVPGLVIEFSTTIADGLNLFGRPLASYDHAFSPSAFATKIFAVGVALEGYVGMDNPTANGGAVEESGGTSPGDPNLAFLDPVALAANPYIYLIPVGTDSMRSPPLGDSSAVRTWNVQDVTIPLPFNIGGSELSTKALWQSEDSLTEPLFNIRKHQAFRPVSDSSIFGTAVIYWTGGELERTSWTNTRLLGRSVWNSKWKIVIPGKTLLNNPDEGLERFIKTVNDIKLYFHTYSYSGN